MGTYLLILDWRTDRKRAASLAHQKMNMQSGRLRSFVAIMQQINLLEILAV